MAPPSQNRTTSPLVTVAVAAVVITVGLSAVLLWHRTAPKQQAVSEPPPLEWNEPSPEVVVASPPPLPEPLLTPPPPPPPAVPVPSLVAAAPQPNEVPVAKLRVDQLEAALAETNDSARKLEIMRRLERARTPSAHFAVSVLLSDQDKAVRLEAIRIVEKIDTANDVLMPKIHAMYLEEQDPEVKAEFDRLIQKFRPQEDAEYRVRQRLEPSAALAPTSH